MLILVPSPCPFSFRTGDVKIMEQVLEAGKQVSKHHISVLTNFNSLAKNII